MGISAVIGLKPSLPEWALCASWEGTGIDVNVPAFGVLKVPLEAGANGRAAG